MPIVHRRKLFWQPKSCHDPAASGTDITTGLKSYWLMNDGSGTTFVDSVSAHNGTLTTSSLWSGDHIVSDGGNNGSVADHADFNVGGSFTIFMWVKGAAQSGNAIVAQYDFGVGQRGWAITTDNLGSFNKFRVVVSDDGTSAAGHIKDYSSTQITCLDGTYHSIAARFNAGTLDLFTDGAKDTAVTKTIDAAITSIFNSTAAISVFDLLNSGSGAGIPPSAGFELKKIRLYNAVKTDADIAAMHALGA